jgi:hypothetical protein
MPRPFLESFLNQRGVSVQKDEHQFALVYDPQLLPVGFLWSCFFRAINLELTYGSRVYTLLQPARKRTVELIEKIKQYLKE